MIFKKKLAINMDTGEQCSVFTPDDNDDRLFATFFFEYFEDVPRWNIVTQWVVGLDVLQDEEDEEEKIEKVKDGIEIFLY